jgi:DNA polymerase
MKTLHIDIETYSATDLLKCGVYKYAEDPAFRLLLFGVSVDDGPVQVYDVEREGRAAIPSTIVTALTDPAVVKWAHNANFERVCLARHFNRRMPPEQWRCTAAWARSLSLPGSLGKLTAALGFPADAAKDKRGKKLIQKFCVSNPNLNHGLWDDDWRGFIEYCRQDVVAEVAVLKYLIQYPMTDSERRVWEIDQHVNDTGLPVDLELVAAIRRIESNYKEVLLKAFKATTGVSNPNSRDQVLDWLHRAGVLAPGLTAGTVDRLLSGELPTVARRVLTDRQQLARTSLAKFDAFERATNADGRARGMFIYHGANTGRWTGQIAQPQNFPRPVIMQSEIPFAREAAYTADAETWAMMYADPMGALASLVRAVIAPKGGGLLTVVDLASIESMKAAWFAESEYLLQLFRDGRDPYKDFASRLYNVPYSQVTKKQRNTSKPASLGSQYGMSPRGLQAYARNFGVDMSDDESKRQTLVWRKSYAEIPACWNRILTAAMQAIQDPRRVFQAARCKFFRGPEFLIIELPSGRKLYYRQAAITQGNYGQEISYQDVVKGTIRTFGARLFENIVQAGARDVLVAGLVNAVAAGIKVIGHVHDEIIAEGDCLPGLIKAMTTPPAWCTDAPIRAAGYVDRFYKKD